MGHDDVKEAATEVRKHFAEFLYTVTRKIQTMHNVATCRWGSGMPGQPFHYTGRPSSKSVMAACQGCIHLAQHRRNHHASVTQTTGIR